MDEKTEQEQAGGDQDEPGTEPAQEFDPDEVENDPSQNPPISELKDLKGG
jgi:hypothetical protein